MNALEKYRRNLIIKSIVIPLIITIAVAGLLYVAAPAIESKLPDGSAYVQNVNTEEENNA